MAPGAEQAEPWEAIDPWGPWSSASSKPCRLPGSRSPRRARLPRNVVPHTPPLLGWQDELRALELDVAARRSAEKGRSSTLDFQESTEEASFKGTMTLLGCSLIWAALLVLIASVWLPWLVWLILPVFGVFLVMQALRWVVRE